MTQGANHVLFKDRIDAGNQLAELLLPYKDSPAIVLGLARGGVLVASRVALAFHIPFDVLVVNKISSPKNPEFALGALAPDGVQLMHWVDIQKAGFDEEYIHTVTSVLESDIGRRMHRLRKRKKPLRVEEKTVILVDDGIATGATMEAAILWARKKRAKQIIVAVPVASHDILQRLRPEVTETVCLKEVLELKTVGEFYKTFEQISDEDVIKLQKEVLL